MKNDPVAYERFWDKVRSWEGGWAKPPRARKWHYFQRDRRARLCRDFFASEPAQAVQSDAPSSSDRCPRCVQRLAIEFLRWNAAAPIYLLTFRHEGPCPSCGSPVEWWTRPPRCIWLPPVDPTPGQTSRKGERVYLDQADMEILPFHRATCPDGYLYANRKTWFAKVEDEALERYERRRES